MHEVKSSSKASEADRAQVIHYCYRLRAVGIQAEGGVLHYPKTRRTAKIRYDEAAEARAIADIEAILAVLARPTSPPRPGRPVCRGCSFADYCWSL